MELPKSISPRRLREPRFPSTDRQAPGGFWRVTRSTRRTAREFGLNESVPRSEGSEHGEENYRYSGGIRICDSTRHRERNHVGSLERVL